MDREFAGAQRGRETRLSAGVYPTLPDAFGTTSFLRRPPNFCAAGLQAAIYVQRCHNP